MPLPKITDIGALKNDVAAVKNGAASGATSGGGFNWGGLLSGALALTKDVIGTSSSSTSGVNIPPPPMSDDNKNMLMVGGAILLLVVCMKK